MKRTRSYERFDAMDKVLRELEIDGYAIYDNFGAENELNNKKTNTAFRKKIMQRAEMMFAYLKDQQNPISCIYMFEDGKAFLSDQTLKAGTLLLLPRVVAEQSAQSFSFSLFVHDSHIPKTPERPKRNLFEPPKLNRKKRTHTTQTGRPYFPPPCLPRIPSF